MDKSRIMESLAVLGLGTMVPPEVLRRTYHKLSLKVHPDKNPKNPLAASKFQSITEAYAYLCSMQNNLPLHPSTQCTEIISIAPLVLPIILSAEQVYRGVMEPIKITREIHLKDQAVSFETETMYIQIPAGSDTGEVLTFKRKGHVHVNVAKGDLRVVIKVLPNPKFTRRGLDLYYEQDVSLKQALCGASYEILHFSGKVLEVRNKSGIVLSPNEEKTVRGYGMKRGDYVGNLYIRFNVQFPKNLSTEQVDRLKAIL